jgi:hypothetical protein
MKSEVSLGQVIDFKGLKITLTQQIIDDNPEMFEVKEEFPEYVECINGSSFTRDYWYNTGIIYPVTKSEDNSCRNIRDENGDHLWDIDGATGLWKDFFKPSTREAFDRQELLKEAKKRYPVGTRVISALSDDHIWNIIGELKWFENKAFYHNIVDATNASVYSCGKWAEIVEPIFVAEDGVGIYKGDELYYVNVKDLLTNYWYWANHPKVTNFTDYKYFSTNTAAEKWIEENKPEKTLEDYENELLKKSGSQMILGCYLFDKEFYNHLKTREPKLYWSKILQLIADDLNGGENTNRNYIMRKNGEYVAVGYSEAIITTLMFCNKEMARKAIKLMGDKLDYIFK